jgi:hypothetical protein
MEELALILFWFFVGIIKKPVSLYKEPVFGVF